jgi:hypothetical protein
MRPWLPADGAPFDRAAAQRTMHGKPGVNAGPNNEHIVDGACIVLKKGRGPEE